MSKHYGWSCRAKHVGCAVPVFFLMLWVWVTPAEAARPVCGDAVCSGSEVCDGIDFCQAPSCAPGEEALCDTGCGGYTCQPSSDACGNGVIDIGEDCDGSNLGGATCGDFGCSSGSLSCALDCTLDTTGCTSCGGGSGTVELLFTDRSDDVSETNISVPEQRLLDLIDNEGVAIKASIDGLSRSNVVDRLIAAHGRGVQVQITADCQIVVADANAYYHQLAAAGIPIVDDNDTFDGPGVNPGCTSNQVSGFVHNKVLIFKGQQTAWTGSTNLTDFGFNSSENAILILSGNSGIVDFFEAELDEMFGNGLDLRSGGTGQFGRQKDLKPGIGSFTLADGSVVEIAFSPYNYQTLSDTEQQINATIDAAADELLWSTFFLTYASVRDKLDASAASSKRGAVDPRTTNDFTDTGILINNGEQVLVTNFLGSHHWKVVIADPDAAHGQVLFGSHNYSNSSFNFNNENSVRVLAPATAASARTEFDAVWNDPQNAGLVGCIHSGESYNANSLALHRCNDAFDNDFDGFTDGTDSDCAAPFTCGGGSCKPAGDACSDGEECCSGTCLHGRVRTCS